MNLRENRDTDIKKEWDVYWAEKDISGNRIYDFFAGIYRRMIIKRILNYFVFKYLPENCNALHAGCGSGQVDVDISRHMNITALDISQNALKIYRKVHGPNARVVQGSIFNLPFPDHSFDAVYNLGVMEHFTQHEIHSVLTEFHRVIKPGGKVLVLWPPVFGLTVFILDSVHFVLNKILRRNIKLHPDEITRLRSKEHAFHTFEKAGFRPIKYYFGAKDMFTQAVIVAEKN